MDSDLEAIRQLKINIKLKIYESEQIMVYIRIFFFVLWGIFCVLLRFLPNDAERGYTVLFPYLFPVYFSVYSVL